VATRGSAGAASAAADKVKNVRRVVMIVPLPEGLLFQI
jgi:hypothetical protein